MTSRSRMLARTLDQRVAATLVGRQTPVALAAVFSGISLLLATVALGLIGRTVPQLNIMALGFGVNALVLPAVLCLSIGAAAWVFQDQIEPVVAMILKAVA